MNGFPGQVWWFTSVIPALRKQRWEDPEFKAIQATYRDPVSKDQRLEIQFSGKKLI
jgi:hypothetical protein